MPSQPTDCSHWLTRELKLHITTFDDSTGSLLKGQEKAFKLCCKLLRENAESFAAQSKATRSIRNRASELLKDVFRVVGPEVFLLCTLVHITKLGKNADRIRISTIQSWWKSTPHPQGLATVATSLCNGNRISDLVEKTYAPPYRTVLRKNDLLDFLQANVEHGSFAIRTPEDPEELPSIEISRQMCQELIMHVMERMGEGREKVSTYSNTHV